jgi:hypothetical protein
VDRGYRWRTTAMILVAGAFWSVMNVLLWRDEFGLGDAASSSIPISVVWEKVLSSADQSVLNIRHSGRTIGTLEWTPSVTETVRTNSEVEIEGMVGESTGYHVQAILRFFGGNTALGKLLVQGGADFGAGRDWTRLEVHVDQRPKSWTLRAEAGTGEVRLSYQEGRRQVEQRFETGDLGTLGALLGPFGALLPGSGGPGPALSPELLAQNLRWTASNDWLKIGRNRVRVYKVTGRFGSALEAVAYVSRAGEILKVQLPDSLQLVNDALAGM